MNTFEPMFFQTWYDAGHHQTLHFDTSLTDFDPHSRSQSYKNARTLHIPSVVEWHEGAPMFAVIDN